MKWMREWRGCETVKYLPRSIAENHLPTLKYDSKAGNFSAASLGDGRHMMELVTQ